MSDYTYDTTGVCAKRIFFSVEDGKLHNVRFAGGCPGNTAGVARLAVGRKATDLIGVLKGVPCRNGTSCPDQFARALEAELAKRGPVVAP